VQSATLNVQNVVVQMKISVFRVKSTNSGFYIDSGVFVLMDLSKEELNAKNQSFKVLF
jgi:hypothetical protein